MRDIVKITIKAALTPASIYVRLEESCVWVKVCPQGSRIITTKVGDRACRAN